MVVNESKYYTDRTSYSSKQIYFKNRFLGAIGRNDLKAVKNLYYKEPSIINYRSITEESPLFKAIINKRLKVVKFLIDSGIDIEAKNINNDTALFYILNLKKNIPYSILKEVLLRSEVSAISKNWYPVSSINTSENIFHLLAKRQISLSNCDWDFIDIMKIIHTKTSPLPCINYVNGMYLTPILEVLIYNPSNFILINEFLKYGSDIWKNCKGVDQLLMGNYYLGKKIYDRLKKEDLSLCLNKIRRKFRNSKPIYKDLQWDLPPELGRCIRKYLSPLEICLSGVTYWNKIPDNIWENILDFVM